MSQHVTIRHVTHATVTSGHVDISTITKRNVNTRAEQMAAPAVQQRAGENIERNTQMTKYQTGREIQVAVK